jgi:A/G-specific adenine glycosylase
LNRDALLGWYDQFRRDLPWRRTSDFWAIWVSEVMLQQTLVGTVIPYWEKWMDRFPSPESLASADEETAMALWQGLGYYRRCRLLRQGAAYVAAKGAPRSYDEWRKVPGVGPYTAGAIASIAFGETVPVVDGNVERVYARVAGDRSTGQTRHRNAWKWAEDNLDRRRPGDWNQALMELGATICRPRNPDCPNCPLSKECVAFQSGLVDEIPAPNPKPSVVQLEQTVWVPWHEGRFGVRQIVEGKWWLGMWEFPRSESTGEAAASELSPLTGPVHLTPIGRISHTVTRHRIGIEVFLAQCESPSPLLRWETVEGLASLPMASPQRKCLQLALGQL